MNREQLIVAVIRALEAHEGRATIVQTAKHIWENNEAELKASGDLYYTWQYEMRWAAQKLRDSGKLTLGREDGRNVWQLVK